MYKLTNTTSIIRLADNATIPADPANADYFAYLQWIKEGNHPEFPPQETTEQIIARLDGAIEGHIQAVIAGRGYVSIERSA
jgi:hypothetical protein